MFPSIEVCVSSTRATNSGGTVELVRAAANLGPPAGIYVPELSEPVKILNLTRQLIKTSGVKKNIPIVFTGLRGARRWQKNSSQTGNVWNTLPTTGSTESRAPRFHPRRYAAMAELENAVPQRDLTALLQVLRRMVPEYRPSESLLALLERLPV